MRFLLVYRPAADTPASAPVLDGWVQEMSRAGVLLATDGFRERPHGTRVRIRGGDFEISDGPVPEPALPAGYAIVQVGTRERAIELAKRFLALAGDSAGEVRLLPA